MFALSFFGHHFGFFFEIVLDIIAHCLLISIGYYAYKYFSDWKIYRQRPSISFTMRTDQLQLLYIIFVYANHYRIISLPIVQYSRYSCIYAISTMTLVGVDFY
uniref:7TM_GPCR_Srx domain-containing protein n=1 Tax=Ascaris lumbricoides TaxID=6252 RepID=A0A0M3HZP1_ASCLU